MINTKKIFDKTFEKCDITYEKYEKMEDKLHCFLKTQPDTDEYLEKLLFKIHKFKDVKKENQYILKHTGDFLVFSINNKIVRISHISIKNSYQQKGIAKELIHNLKYFIEKEYPTIESFTLYSLATGVIAWHKIGFEFFNTKDKLLVKTILSKLLGKNVNLKKISKEEIEETNFYDIVKEKIDHIPMVLKVKQ